MSVNNKTDALLDELMYCDFRANTGVDKAKKLIRLALKSQDRDTRHACAEAVMNISICHTNNDNAVYDSCGHIVEAIPTDDAHNACMNVNTLQEADS